MRNPALNNMEISEDAYDELRAITEEHLIEARQMLRMKMLLEECFSGEDDEMPLCASVSLAIPDYDGVPLNLVKKDASDGRHSYIVEVDRSVKIVDRRVLSIVFPISEYRDVPYVSLPSDRNLGSNKASLANRVSQINMREFRPIIQQYSDREIEDYTVIPAAGKKPINKKKIAKVPKTPTLAIRETFLQALNNQLDNRLGSTDLGANIYLRLDTQLTDDQEVDIATELNEQAPENPSMEDWLDIIFDESERLAKEGLRRRILLAQRPSGGPQFLYYPYRQPWNYSAAFNRVTALEDYDEEIPEADLAMPAIHTVHVLSSLLSLERTVENHLNGVEVEPEDGVEDFLGRVFMHPGTFMLMTRCYHGSIKSHISVNMLEMGLNPQSEYHRYLLLQNLINQNELTDEDIPENVAEWAAEYENSVIQTPRLDHFGNTSKPVAEPTPSIDEINIAIAELTTEGIIEPTDS